MKLIIQLMVLLSLFGISCTALSSDRTSAAELDKLKQEKDSLKTSLAEYVSGSNQSIATFFTFQKGNAEEAMRYYVDMFDNSKVIDLQLWEKGGPGKEGKVMHATFTLDGELFMCSDSPPIHEWDFSPAVSNYVDCKNNEEIEKLFAKLAENGEVTMPLNNYGFSQKFGWVIDQFGISWQLNLK